MNHELRIMGGRKLFLSLLVFLFLNSYFLIHNSAPAWAAASLSLSPASGTKAIGDTFDVDVVLDTGGEAVSGATAIINYDTARLQVTTGTSIIQGTIFNQVPLNNEVNSATGQIRYDSGSLGTTYIGRGTMAKIRFRTLAAGTAQVSFVFDPSTTINTSLVAAASGPTNLLTSVNDGAYSIVSGSVPVTPMPATGAVENTLAAIGGGLFLLIGGFFLRLKLLK